MDQQVNQLVRLAPAKINLALHVTGQRDDGYHLLESFVAFAEIGDRLCVEHSESDEFVVSGRFASHVPISSSNLVIKARDRLRGLLDLKQQHSRVRIHLEKNLPVASGIGGGSSDAAAALVALACLWSPNLDRKVLRDEIGLGLGADVPMCVDAKPLLAKGIGQETTLVDGFPALALVMANPGPAVNTSAIFAALKQRNNPGLPPLPPSLELSDMVKWLGETRNDLQEVAVSVEPEIGEALSELDQSGAAFARMSGSGATCFGIFSSIEAATEAAGAIQARRPGWFVVATEAR
ncbi:MAG: 4-(cytidine 5'-diphospho)-2-C-methyl-D-erythritol kinase [Rhizobiaceae bacterium]|nr:4-(cytidine 5'-diphospho)-2-C-methyl-D-erythritol kinase [Rhizobiaceae bacterium]